MRGSPVTLLGVVGALLTAGACNATGDAPKKDRNGSGALTKDTAPTHDASPAPGSSELEERACTANEDCVWWPRAKNCHMVPRAKAWVEECVDCETHHCPDTSPPPPVCIEGLCAAAVPPRPVPECTTDEDCKFTRRKYTDGLDAAPFDGCCSGCGEAVAPRAWGETIEREFCPQYEPRTCATRKKKCSKPRRTGACVDSKCVLRRRKPL